MPLPDRIAALPDYISSNSDSSFEDASPGHRFLMYFRNWQGTGGNQFDSYKGKVKVARDLPRDVKRIEEGNLIKHNVDILGKVCPFGPSARTLIEGLRNRQKSFIESFGSQGYRQTADSTAPFSTGLGNEHPIENGFSFLTPYGLPYLAGSGVKGVLRRAAEDLALAGPETGWTWLDIWWLFGFEGAAGALWKADAEIGGAFAHDIPALAAREDLADFIRIAVADKNERARFLDSKEDRRGTFLNRLLQDQAFRQSIHTRGALDFWDVFPSPDGNKLVVEIMTPHHTNYFQNGGTPNDAESPTPITFLAIPAKSAFDFHVVCHTTRLPASLLGDWRQKLDRAFAHAFAWLGFGAKTSVGYGAMGPQAAPRRPANSIAAAAGRSAPIADTPALVWEKAQIKFNQHNGTLTAIRPSNLQANAIAPKGAELLASLPPTVQQKIKQNQFVRVSAVVQGVNLLSLVAPE